MSVTVVLNILFTLSYPESRNNLAKIEASPRLMFRGLLYATFEKDFCCLCRIVTSSQSLMYTH